MSLRPEERASAAYGPGLTKKGWRLFIGSSSTKFSAFSEKGKELWYFLASGKIISEALYSDEDDRVLFSCSNGKFYALNATTGRPVWTFVSNEISRQPPVISDGTVIFSTSANRVFGLDQQSGRWKWQFDGPRPAQFSVDGHAGVLALGNVIYTGLSDGTVLALRPSTGAVLWSKRIHGPDVQSASDVDTTPVAFGENILVASYSAGLHAISPDNGEIVWSRPVPGIIAISVSGPNIFLATQDAVVALDEGGHTIWHEPFSKGYPSEVLTLGAHLLVTGSESGLAVVSSETGDLMQYFNPGSGLSSRPTAFRNIVSVLANRGHLYVFEVVGMSD